MAHKVLSAYSMHQAVSILLLMKHKVIFVTRPEMEPILKDMKLHYAASLEDALVMAKADRGEDASITVIPNGISVMVK